MPRAKLINLLDLDKAFKRVIREERKGRKLIPDALCFCDCQAMQNDIVSDIKRLLDSRSYRNQPLLTMDVPRDNFCIRPAAVPKLEDWVIYDAFANYIGRQSDVKLAPTVFSYRFDKNGELLPGVGQWKKFENSFSNLLAQSKPDSYVVITDIASYFTNINLKVLRNHLLTIIGGSPTNANVIDNLFNALLIPWATGPLNKDLGIPQGVDASSIIGNLLLHHIDAEIGRIRDVKYFRYMDDIRIITKNNVTAKKMLRGLIKSLGQIGLNVNTQKTKILSKSEVRALEDPRSEDMTLIDRATKSRRRSEINLVMPILQRVFDRAFDKNNSLYQRHLSFAINRFILLRNELKRNRGFMKKVPLNLISNLEKLPGCTEDFSRFFKYFPSSSYKQYLVNFLKSQENIYEWQEMWILDGLLRFQRITQDDVRVFEEIAKDRRKHELCRAKAILLIGKFGDAHTRHDLTTLYSPETEEVIRRAIVFACQELTQAERNTFYDMVKADDRMKHAISYIKQLRKPKYYEDEEWTPIDIPDWGTY